MTETCDWDDLVRREGIYYKKSTDVPFTGKVTGKDPEYNRKTQGSFKDGKWDGPYVSYHYNGQLWEKCAGLHNVSQSRIPLLGKRLPKPKGFLRITRLVSSRRILKTPRHHGRGEQHECGQGG